MRPQSCDLSCELARNTSSQTVGESFDTQSTVQPYDVRDNARRRDSAPGRGGSTASDRHAGTGALQCIVCIGAARNRIPARGAYPARATSDPVPVRVFWGRSGAAREVHPIRRIAICIHPISCAYLRARPRAIFGISRASRVAVLDFIYFTTLYLLSELVPYGVRDETRESGPDADGDASRTPSRRIGGLARCRVQGAAGERVGCAY